MLKTQKQLLRGDHQELNRKECWTQIETKNTRSEADLAVVTSNPTNWRLEGEGWTTTSSVRKKNDSTVQAKVSNFWVTCQALTADLS